MNNQDSERYPLSQASDMRSTDRQVSSRLNREVEVQRADRVRAWTESTIADNGCEISLERVGRHTALLSTHYSGQAHDLLIDGLPRPTWSLSDRVAPSSSLLFSALGELLQESSACWVSFLFHDDAYLEIGEVTVARWEDAKWFANHSIATRRADEAGTTAMGLVFEDFKDVFQISDGWDDAASSSVYTIDHYGESGRLASVISFIEANG